MHPSLFMEKVIFQTKMGNITTGTSSFKRRRSSRRATLKNNSQIHRLSEECNRLEMTSSENNLNQESKLGIVHIFNHKYYTKDSGCTTRYGTEHDVTKLKTIFKRFNYNINIHENFALYEIYDKMKEIKNEDYTQNSCVIIIVLSHGFNNSIVYAKDQPYNFQTFIRRPLLQNKTLEFKPKLLIIQACKGPIDLRTNQMPLHSDAQLVNPINEYQIIQNEKLYCPSDFITFYSTSEGYVSYRSPSCGSVFIQTLCKIIENHGEQKSVQEIFRLTTGVVKKITRQTQIPEVSLNADEPIYFGKQSP